MTEPSLEPQTPRGDLSIKEPYPYFFAALHNLLLAEAEYTRLRSLLIKIFLWGMVALVVMNVMACILAAIVPIAGMSLITWILSGLKIGTPAGGYGG